MIINNEKDEKYWQSLKAYQVHFESILKICQESDPLSIRLVKFGLIKELVKVFSQLNFGEETVIISSNQKYLENKTL